jgi:tetratricopeptide (TPR) repeat protein
MEEALQLFNRCYLLTGSIEAGINSATLLLLSGKKREAYKRADDTARHCRLLIMENKKHELGYYAATIAEVNLLKGRLEAAELWYKSALSENSRVSEKVLDNMNLLLNHLVPEPDMVARIRESVGA